MKGEWGLLVVTVATWLSLTDGRGIDLGLCSNENVVCACGTGGVQINLPIKRCTFFYRWKPYCKACEKYDKDALCSQFRHCLSCENRIDGACSACPVGRYGKNCQGVCQCQNGGVCNRNNGHCQCLRGYRGALCEKSDHKVCGRAPTLRHGTATGATGTTVPEGGLVMYRCDTGYALVGPAQKRCESGRWSGGETRCEYMCEVPRSRPNLKVKVEHYVTMATADNPKGVKLVRRVKFSCEAGYVLRGLPELNCLPSSQWNGAVPTCELETSCSPPVFKGQITPKSASYIPGATVTFSCTPDYSLRGANSVRCQKNGKWNAPIPKCVPKAKTCSALTAPANGQILNNNGQSQAGHKVQYKCSSGFRLSGPEERECLTDGTWSGAEARCVKVIVCMDPGTPQNGDRETRDVRSRITGRGRGPGSRRRKPTSGQRSRMSSSADIPSGQFAVNTLLTFSCKKGYNLVGSASRTCQTSGQWSGEQPRCTPVCGKSDGARAIKIINGEVSREGDYPWQVMLAHRRSDGEFYGVCGATLISENWVVTAAHCVTEEGSINLLPKDIMKVYLGKYHRDNSKDSKFVQEFTVSEIRVNPGYDPLLLDSDIALIKLSGQAELNDRVMPICLAENSLRGTNLTQNLMKSGSFVTVTGWGETEKRVDADRLLVTRLMTISNKECEDRYSETNLPLVVTANMFCAGHDDGRSDTCFGDSGGPAVAYNGGGENRLWYLVGVVSWGSPLDCGIPKQYSGFTRISNFLDFIHSNTGL